MKLKVALITAAALVSLSASADATTTIITYQGTVDANSSSLTGSLFGNDPLDGLAFTAVYTLILPTPGMNDTTTYTIPGDDAAGQRVVGGNTPSNPLTATLTINGHSLNIGDAYGQSVRASGNAYGFDFIQNLGDYVVYKPT